MREIAKKVKARETNVGYTPCMGETKTSKGEERGKMRIFWERERGPLKHVWELKEGMGHLQGKRKGRGSLHVKIV